MKRTNASTIGTTLLVTLALSVGYLMLPKVQSARAASPVGASAKPRGTASHSAQQRARAAHGTLPVSFEVNQGQFDAEVQFASRGASYRAFVTRSETVFVMTNLPLEAKDAARTAKAAEAARGERKPLSTSVVRMSLVGANASAVVTGLEQLPGKINYFRGNDRTKWLRDVPTFNRVQVASVYPGVDLVYYGKGRELEYDLVVAPGAEVSQIAFNFEGAERVEVDPATAELVVHTAGGAQLRQSKPLLYQELNGSRHAVSGGFTVNGSRVGFAIGEYDAARPLVIDPVVISYSTYLGGEDNDQAHDVSVDAAGNAHVVGWTVSTDFPTRNGYDTTKNEEEAFVTKFNADGSGLIWSTYLGGSGTGILLPPCPPVCDSSSIQSHEDNGLHGDDGVYAVALDGDGNVYLTGFTDSTDFPTENAMQQHLARDDDPFDGGQDSFIAKLNAAGNQLLFSTYFGGVGTDVGRGIAVDSNNDVYVTGYTDAVNFPTTNPIQPELGRRAERSNNDVRFDAYLAKIGFAPSGQMFRVYSTYLGGDLDDTALDVAVDAAGNAYVTGWTESTRGACENGNGVGGPVGALYGADGAGGNSNTQLYILDPATGEVVETIGAIGYSVTGLAFDPVSGVLYGSVGNVGPSANSLITIDPETGAGTLVGSFGVGGVADIASDADGNLFGWARGTNYLYLIDKATGAASLVGDSNIGSFGNGLAFDSSGALYLAAAGADGPLYLIDPETGAACEGPTMTGAPARGDPISALKFAPEGLYGANLRSDDQAFLVLIDAQTGAITNRGRTVDRLTAIAFAPPAGSEPTPAPPAPPSPTPRARNFPTTAGAFQQEPPNFATRDAFVTKVNPEGSAYVYSTFLSGAEEDVSWSIAVGSDGSAYVAGYTDSENAPAANPAPSPAPTPQGFPTTANAYQRENSGGYDAFLSRLNPAGAALIYSTYLGGDQDEGTGADSGECLTCLDRYDGAAVALDFAGNAYITGWTQSTFVAASPSPSPMPDASPTPVNFPTKDAAQPQPGSSPDTQGEAARDAFVAKFNTNAATGEDSLVYSTFLGGPERDEGQGIAVDPATNAYVTGVTGSSECDCPRVSAAATFAANSAVGLNAFITTEGAFQENPIGNEDAFLIKISGGTFAGGSGVGGDGTGFILSGRVTQSDGTTPVPGVTITLTRPGNTTSATTTDANGIYFFEDLAPGTYTVTPSGGGFVYTPPSQTVVIDIENERADFTASTAPTPTPTATATATPTPTASPSPSVSPSPSPTASPTPPPASQPINLSTRLNVDLGDRLGIGGFIITGTGAETRDHPRRSDPR